MLAQALYTSSVKRLCSSLALAIGTTQSASSNLLSGDCLEVLAGKVMPTAMLVVLADVGLLSVQVHHGPGVFTTALVLHH